MSQTDYDKSIRTHGGLQEGFVAPLGKEELRFYTYISQKTQLLAPL